MRSKTLWSVVLLVVAAGVFARGRSNPGAKPRPPGVEKPAAATPAAPVQPSTPVATSKSRTAEAPVAHGDRKAHLRLRVVGVHDGDTLTGLDDTKTQHKIRLDAIDAPELGQPHGQAAKQALSGKVFGKDVVVIPKTTDRYGRTIGHVMIDGRDVNLEMLEAGMAWHYEQYDHNARLREAEQQARAAKKGLWKGQSPEPPWDWRRQKRGGPKSS